MSFNKRFIDGNEYFNLAKILADKLPKEKYDFVIGIPRGGLVLATYISHILKIDMIILEKVDDDEIMGIFGERPKNAKRILIVDDIVDTGNTISSGNLLKYNTATLFTKPRSHFQPTYYGEKIDNNQWIVFPYEDTEEVPNREI